MTSITFRKTFAISFLAHTALFSIFSFSFGSKIPIASYTQIAFWGAILDNSDLMIEQNFINRNPKYFQKPDTLALSKIKEEPPSLVSAYYLKPASALELNKYKMIFFNKSTSIPFGRKEKRQEIMFYPHLPEHFLLYFKDRDVVHIELMFNIISKGPLSSILIKRKISSGNLEADLLSMRYISHYLFIQQASFFKDNWQTVKIELCAKK